MVISFEQIFRKRSICFFALQRYKEAKKGLASGADKSAFAAHTEKGAMAGFEVLMKKSCICMTES